MAVSTGTATELTREQVANLLVKPLEEASKFLAAGPRIFDTNETLRIPKLGAPTDLSFVGENEQIPEADPDFDEVTLLPTTMKSVKTLTRYSNELARQSVVNLDAALRDRLVTDVAAKLDAQFFSAGGDGITTPQGMFAWTGTQTLAVLVDFAQVAVARDLAPTVKILDQTFGDYDQMAIRVVARYDAKPLNAEAVVKLTGITV